MNQETDLTNCDREPIHIPGKIQAHGVLLAIDNKEKKITHVSDNLAEYFGISPQQILALRLRKPCRN